MKKIYKNILKPLIIILVTCGVFILCFFNPIERANVKLQEFFVGKRADSKDRIYTNIIMNKFVDESFRDDFGDTEISASLYIYEDKKYKYIEVVPMPDFLNSYHIAYDKNNNLAIFSNYGESKGEEIMRYYINDNSVTEIYVLNGEQHLRDFSGEKMKNYKIEQVIDCLNYYLNYKAQ